MLMTKIDAQTVLARFHGVTRNISKSVAETFPAADYEDIEQEAKILVLGYAGVMTGRHAGALASIETTVDGDERQVKAVLGGLLKRDLKEAIGRQCRGAADMVPLEDLPQDSEPGYDDFEVRAAEDIDRRDSERYAAEKYPFLAMRFMREMSEKDIVRKTGLSLRTVQRRVNQERRAAAEDPILMARAGIRSTPYKGDGGDGAKAVAA